MGAFNIPQGQDLGQAFMSDPGNRKRLIQAVMGSDPSAAMQPPQNDRIADDLTRHPAGFEENARVQTPGMGGSMAGSTEDLESQATPQRLLQRMQQTPQAPSHLDQLQSQYDQMQEPQQKPLSPWKTALTGVLTAGVGIPLMMKNRADRQQYEEGRYDRNRASLLGQIEAERRIQQQGESEMGKERLAQQMQSERERAQQASQERMFGQQSQIEGQRETLRQKMQQDAENARQASQNAMFQQQDKRQAAQFGQQEKLLSQREQNKQADQKATADETRRADLARNMNENLDQLEGIVQRRPDLFGPMAGRMTQAKSWLGTSDPDIAALNTIKEMMGMAQVGAHAMRNAQHVETAANSIVNSFHNDPAAILQAIAMARNSVATFQQDAGQPTGSAPKNLKSQVQNVAPEGTRVQVGNQIMVKKGGKWVPE